MELMEIQDFKKRLARFKGDVQSMMMATANYIMAHAYVNVAIFLPNRYGGDWTLATVCTPRMELLTENVQFELFEIGGQIGQLITHESKVICGTNEEISVQLNEKVSWMDGFNMLFAPSVCNEPLCLLMLFVTRGTQFSESTKTFLAELGQALGEEIEKYAKEARERPDHNPDEDGEMESGVSA